MLHFVGLLQLLGFTELVELYKRRKRVACAQRNDFKMIGIAGMTTSWGVVCSFQYFSHLIYLYSE